MIFEGFHFPEFPDAQRQTRPPVRLSFKESRMKFIDLTNFGQEIRVWVQDRQWGLATGKIEG
jgi:hypothetical protein